MMQRLVLSLTTVLLLVAVSSVVGFCPNNNPHRSNARFSTQVGIFDKVGQFFEELDAFVDDATARRLGNGSAFYGKRKSSFYGKDDKDRKRDRSIPDPTGKLLLILL
jgi:hypothetical protein